MSFYSRDELQTLGLSQVGEDVKISRTVSIYNPGQIKVGSHVRIDDFSVLSGGAGGIEIGDHVHVSVYCLLVGAGKITLSDFSGISSRVSVYSSNDDYSGKHLTNPTVPLQFLGVTHGDVFLGKHVIVGAGAVVLPGLRLEEGVAVGSLSLVTRDCEAFGVYVGTPARRIRERKRDLLELEKELRRQSRGDS